MQDFTMFDYVKVLKMCRENKEESSPIPWDLKVDPYVYLTTDCKTFAMELDEVIVGYAIFFYREHHHYGKVIAIQDVMYVSPEHRGLASIKFIKFIESSLKELNVEGIIQTTTTKKDISKLLERLDYKPVAVEYFKEI